MNVIIVLCAECHNVPIEAKPTFGDAMACAEKLGKAIRAEWSRMEEPAR